MKELVQLTRYPRSEFVELITELNTVHRAHLLEPQIPLEDASAFRITSVTEASRRKPPECTTCGVCCVLPLVVNVSQTDKERLDDHWEVTVEDVVVGRVIGRDMETGRCVNLEGTPRESIGCRIYESRPHVCRVFDAGSDRCLEYRRMYGVDPQLSEKELAAALSRIKPVATGTITDAAIDLASEQISIGLAADGSGAMVTTSTKMMRVTVGFDRDRTQPLELYEYDASKEEWLENDFIGLTLEQAHQKIAERTEQGSSN